MGPVLNLACGVAALLLLYRVFRTGGGWYWRWHGRPRDAARAQTEDALKHLYHSREAGRGGTIESLAGALQVDCDGAAELAQRLERRALVTLRESGLELTEAGRQYALRVIRTHRLWEHYLAHETGMAEPAWHEQADRMEHDLSPDEVDALSARMGHPVYDPHGDPIPTARGDMPAPEGRPLNTVPAGGQVRVVHVEDEPETTYRELLAARLEPGMTVNVLASNAQGVQLDTGLERRQLAPLVAAQVTVEPVSREEAAPLPARTLSSLAPGEAGVVASLAPACRGVERRRLLDLGLVPGTRVVAEFPSPIGDPVAYRIRGALIALRKQQTDAIYLVP